MPRYAILEHIDRFAGDTCFVCRRALTAEGATKKTLEHLIPQWMIKKYDLTASTVTFEAPLGALRYMDVLLPCCAECNSTLLAPVEGRIARAFRTERWHLLERQDIAVWSAKILLGMLLYWRANNDVTSEEFSGESLCRDYLAMLRGQVHLRHRNQFAYPFSLIWLATKAREDPQRNFDFVVSNSSLTLYMRCGNVSLLARPDMGYVERHGGWFFQPYVDAVLAPLQVEELAAHFFTLAGRAKGSHTSSRKAPKTADEPVIVEYLELPRREPFVVPFDDDDFRFWFCRTTGAQEDHLFSDSGAYKTFLKDNDGKFLEVDADVGWH